jgi:hypothetical protein
MPSSPSSTRRRHTGAGSALATSVIVGLTTLLFVWPLGWNRFPLVYWDTSEYLWRWAIVRPGFDRPIFYSLLIGAFRPLPFGLFGVVLLQAVLTATLLALLGLSVFPGARGARWVAILGGLAIAFSPTVFHISTLMPDVSTLWIGLALPLIVLAPVPATAWFAGAVTAAAATLHTSNLPILVGAVPAALLAARFTGRPMARPAWILASVLAFQALAFGWNSSRAGLGFSPRPTGSEFFLAARLQEGGLLERAFREIGAEASPRVPRELAEEWARRLASRPRSVQGLLWDAESPLNHDFPGWRDDVTDYRRATAVLRPAVLLGLKHHPFEFARTGIDNVLEMASGRNELQGFVPHGEGSGVQRVLAERWGDDLNRYRQGRQGSGMTVSGAFPRYTRFWTRATTVATALVALLAIVLGGSALRRNPRAPRRSREASSAAFLLCVVVAVNLLACGFFSMASSRYLERVVALPFVALVVLACSWRGESAVRS